MNCPRAVLLGASSQIGWFAAPRLAGAGYSVLAVSRGGQPARFPSLEAVRWLRLGELTDDGASLLVSAGPLTLVCEVVQRLSGLTRVVAFSTSSVAVKADSPDPLERRQMASIADAERRLSATCAERGIDLVLLRPTLVYGCGLDGNVSRLARWMRWLPVLPIAGDGRGLRQPVHADDLARVAVAAARSDLKGIHELYLGGGSTLSYRDMLERIARALGRPLRVWPLPAGLLATVAGMARRLLPHSGLGPEMVRRQSRDLVFDDSPARRQLGHDPRPFEPRPEDFHLPAPDRLRALAAS